MANLPCRNRGACGALAAAAIACVIAPAALADQQEPGSRVDAALAAADRATDAGADEQAMRALLDLGSAQLEAGDLQGAESSFGRVLESGAANARLDTTLRTDSAAGLALTRHRAKRHEAAVKVFPLAIELNRRSRGLFNLDQVGLLDAYADSLTNLGRLEEARSCLEYAVRIAAHAYGEADTRIAERFVVLGEWFLETGDPVGARESLERGVQIIEDANGKMALALVRPLSALADTYAGFVARSKPPSPGPASQSDPMRERGTGGQVAGLPYDKFRGPWSNSLQELRLRQRAASVAAGRPDTPPNVAAAAHLGVGDWYQARNRPADAVEHYRRAWQACAAGDEVARRSCADWFESPVLLAYVPPESAGRLSGQPLDQVVEQRVEVRLVVTSLGRVADVQEVSGEAPERRVRETIEAARTARYRPRIVDGEPEATSGVRFRQVFRVSASEVSGS